MSDKQFTGLSVHWGIRCALQGEQGDANPGGEGERGVNPRSPAIISLLKPHIMSAAAAAKILNPPDYCRGHHAYRAAQFHLNQCSSDPS